jgi:hypothetical protein
MCHPLVLESSCEKNIDRKCLKTGHWRKYSDLRQETDENSIIRGFIIYTLHLMVFGDRINEDEAGWI